MRTHSFRARGRAGVLVMLGVRMSVVLVVLALANGCEDTYWGAISPAYALAAGSSQLSNGGPPPVGADIGGKWGGRYVDQENGYTEPISAAISQEGSNLVIRSHFLGADHLFTGWINEGGTVHVLDAYDGETWTTWTPATSAAIDLLDYLYRPSPGLEYDPLQVLEMRR